METIKLKNNIWKFNVMKFFYALCFAIPILVIFRQENWLSMTEIMLLQSIYAIFMVFLEVPSGYLADIFWRKKSIIVWVFLWLIGNIIVTFGYWFVDFLIAELVFAIWTAALSWADTAFIYDTLKDLWREKEYKKIWWNATLIFLITMAIAQILWWIIAEYWLPFWIFESVDNLRLTLFISLPFLFLAIPFAFSLYEPNKHKSIIKKWYLNHMFVTLKEEVLSNKNILWMMWFFMVLWASYSFALWFYQPYFKQIGFNLLYFGIIFWWFQIFSAIVSKYTYKIEQKLWFSYTIILSTILVIISYIGMWINWAMRWLIFCFFQQFVRWLYWILSTDYIHSKVSSQYRATMQSIQNLWKSLVYAIFLPIFWRVADIYSLSDSLIIIGLTSAIILIPTLIVLFKIKLI